MENNSVLENGAVEAIKRGHHALREATFVLLTNEGLLALQRQRAGAAIDAVVPMMTALTGMSREALLEAALKRLVKDGRISGDLTTAR